MKNVVRRLIFSSIESEDITMDDEDSILVEDIFMDDEDTEEGSVILLDDEASEEGSVILLGDEDSEEGSVYIDEDNVVYRNDVFRCTVCGESLGYQNPRQLCKKTYCENQI